LQTSMADAIGSFAQAAIVDVGSFTAALTTDAANAIG
jgi:hypothetical protein